VKESRLKAGLYTIVKTPSTASSNELLIDALGELANQPPPTERMAAWLNAIEAQLRKILPPLVPDSEATARGVDERPVYREGTSEHPESVVVFAKRCYPLLVHAQQYLAQPRLDGAQVAHAMEIAAELADEWHSLMVNANLDRPMQGAIRTSEGGKAGGEATARARRPKAEAHWKLIVADVRKLKSAGWARDEIVRRVTSEKKKYRVKPSTFKKNPKVRTLLPASRRKPSP
jgi:hypothetical protein